MNKKDIDITFGNVKKIRNLLISHFGQSFLLNVKKRSTGIRCFQELKNTEKNERKWVVELHNSITAQKAQIGIIIQSQCEMKKNHVILQDLAQKEYRNIKFIDGLDMVEVLMELMIDTKAAKSIPDAFKLIGLKCPMLYSRKRKRTSEQVLPQCCSPGPTKSRPKRQSIETQREIVKLLEEGNADLPILKKQKVELAMMLIKQND